MGFGLGSDILSSAIAGKPKIPDWANIDLGQQQTNAIKENNASLPGLESTASNLNSFNANQIQNILGQFIPGFAGISNDTSSRIDALLKGEIPADVANNLQASDAAKALTGGFGGSGLSGNLTARDLGLTSLNLIDQGINSAQSWISKMASIVTPQLFNVSSMFVSPQQQFEDTFQNQTQQFQDEYAQDLNSYSHSLGVAAGQDIQDSLSTATSLLGGFMGAGGLFAGGGGSKTNTGSSTGGAAWGAANM